MTGIVRVKRMTCKDCCFLDWLEPRMCGKIFSCGNHNDKFKEYLVKRFKNRNGCRSLSLLHFSHRGHRYRPGFMKLKEEENGEMWVYYDHNEEQSYDKSCHRPTRAIGLSTSLDRS